MTNLEGRVILRQRAFDPPPGVHDEIFILHELAQRLGKGQFFPFTHAREIFEELRSASAGGTADYSGITYERIQQQKGIFWPCPDEEHPGTPRLFEHSFPTPSGRARFHAVRHQTPAEEPEKEYPLYLTTGRVLPHYQSGTQTRRVQPLNDMQAEPLAEIHPATARQYGLVPGEYAMLTTRRGSAICKVKVTTTIREDTIFMPFHFPGLQSANRLTNAALDPTSRMPEFKVCAVKIAPAQSPYEQDL